MQHILTGSYSHTVDAKNRIRIPAKLRADLIGEPIETEEAEQKKFSLVFHLGTDGCIEVYTQETVDTIYAQFADVKKSDVEKYRAVRKYLSTFETVESDPQGRLVIPLAYKKYADIDKDIVICGAANCLTIWSKARYEEYIGPKELSVDDVADLAKLLGI